MVESSQKEKLETLLRIAGEGLNVYTFPENNHFAFRIHDSKEGVTIWRSQPIYDSHSIAEEKGKNFVEWIKSQDLSEYVLDKIDVC